MPEDSQQEKNQEIQADYFFEISLAGKQSRCVKLEFFCITKEELEQGKQTLPSDADAIWLLGEVPFFEAGRNISEGNVCYKERQIPIYLLLSLFEHLERFKTYNREITLTQETYEQLMKWGENMLPDDSDFLKLWRILPVQIYGGIQFTDWDEEGNPIYKIGKSGYYQRYAPVGCQMPLFYTLQDYVKSQKANFFTEYEGNKLWNAVFQCFLPYCKNRVLIAQKFTEERKKISEKAEI